MASGLHTVSALYRLVYDGLMSRVAVAAGRGVTVRAKAPVHPDELIDVRTTISDVQESPTRAGYGIVTITAEGTNPAGDVAMVATFEALVHRRAALPEAS